MDLTIKYLGTAALAFIILAFVAGLLLGALYLAVRFIPRLNVGAPINEGELCFYDYQSITTGKDGERVGCPSPRELRECGSS